MQGFAIIFLFFSAPQGGAGQQNIYAAFLVRLILLPDNAAGKVSVSMYLRFITNILNG